MSAMANINIQTVQRHDRINLNKKPELKGNFRRRHNFDYLNGKPIIRKLIDSTDLNSSCQLSKIEYVKNKPSTVFGHTHLNTTKRVLPVDDNKVLTFNGEVPLSLNNLSDIYPPQSLVVNYFIKDGTMLVKEKYEKKLTSNQLSIRKTQKKNEDEFYHWKDLNLGEIININGLNINLLSCSKSTENFYEKNGIHFNKKTSTPNKSLKQELDEREINRINKTDQFPKLDNTLNFYCIWNMNNCKQEESIPCIFLYYLSDGTMALTERPSVNENVRVVTKVIIERQKIYKKQLFLEPSKDSSEYDYLESYTPEDFAIGKTLDLCGHRFLLYDCDRATKEFYTKNYGVTDFTPVPISLNYPYYAWGPIEISFQENEGIAQKVKHPFWSDRHYGVTFNYSARLHTDNSLEKLRRFVIHVHISDETISVHEKAVNGFLTGPYLSRRLVPKNVGDWRESGSPYYTYKDFHVGKTVELFRQTFLITAADEFIDKYKKSHPGDFPEAKEQ